MACLRLPTLILILVLWTGDVLYSQSYITEEGYAEFESSAPLLTFKGVSNHLAGLIDLDENLVDFYLDLNTLETGINRRDRDMRTQYLETHRFPYAEFTGRLAAGFDPDLLEAQEVAVNGVFKIHGVEQEITVEGIITPTENGALLLEASWSVLLEDHDIDRPRVVFFELADEQKIFISAELERYENN